MKKRRAALLVEGVTVNLGKGVGWQLRVGLGLLELVVLACAVWYRSGPSLWVRGFPPVLTKGWVLIVCRILSLSTPKKHSFLISCACSQYEQFTGCAGGVGLPDWVQLSLGATGGLQGTSTEMLLPAIYRPP